MRKIVGKNIFGMAVMAAVFTMSPMMISGCTSQSAQPVTTQETSTRTSGVQSAKSFKPIPMARVATGNYTDEMATAFAQKECQWKNLHSMVGMTFMAYPSNEQPFTTVKNSNERGYGDFNYFGVRSPERFTITSVEDAEGSFLYQDPTESHNRYFREGKYPEWKGDARPDNPRLTTDDQGSYVHRMVNITNCRMNIKFESGKTAFINVSINSYPEYPRFGDMGDQESIAQAIPDFIKCLQKIQNVAH